MSNPILDAALEYREAGLHPIPITPRGKRPAIPSWKQYQDAMPTEEEIRGWWVAMPDANVALVMGRGAFAVDIDGPEGEQALATAGIDLSRAPRSRTSRGYHVFLAGQEIPDRIGLLPKVDVRGVGYVVAPPSVHESGHVYTWERRIEGVLPPGPERLYDLIRSKPAGAVSGLGGTDWFTQALVGVGEGGRDQTCTRLAGYLLGKGLPQEAVELILQSWAEKCTPPFPPDQVSKCVESIAKREGGPAAPPHSLAEALDRVLGDLKRPAANRIVAATEFDDLDQLLDGGFEPGLIYMGARPSIGKSALALHIARKVAAKQGVLYVSREMSSDSLVRRMIAQASEGALTISDLKTGKLIEPQKDMLPVVADRLRGLNMWITTDVITTAHLETALAAYTPGTLGLVVVDYLQMVKPSQDIRDSRQRVEAVSEELKRLAIQHSLPFLVLSSLRRPERAAANWRPTMADLRESGELEHDADAILLLHREPDGDVMEVNLAKQRDGGVGQITLRFHKTTVSFKGAK
jgi:hypothetical protein